MKIYLVGMPGSGKTTLGRQAATEWLLDFVDLDEEIEKREGKSVADIFRDNGETYFRQVEAELLRQWAGSDKSFVMATGGGTPCFHDGIEIMNRTGLSVYLDVPDAQLIDRLRHTSDRPLLATSDDEALRQKLAMLREQRIACYHRAMMRITEPSLQALLDKVNLKI